ncbi:MAG: tryptophan synthase subunit alpha [Oscillospiraceae bacterium]
MSKIRDAFKNGKAFVAFITGGDPDIAATEKLITAMEKAGADIIEIGIPFSDPIAEGPVIQAASRRALDAGTTVDKLFDMVNRLQQTVRIPLLFMTYANPVFAYGTERFMQKCQESGIAGLILPDVPFEEKDNFQPACDKFGIELISLVSPTSDERAEAIARQAQGFLYCVSSLGVTGVRSHIGNEISGVIARVRNVSDIPCAIGFGISTPEQAGNMAKISDGVIVGSAIVKIVGHYGKDAVPYVSEYVAEMKAAIRNIEHSGDLQ